MFFLKFNLKNPFPDENLQFQGVSLRFFPQLLDLLIKKHYWPIQRADLICH